MAAKGAARLAGAVRCGNPLFSTWIDGYRPKNATLLFMHEPAGLAHYPRTGPIQITMTNAAEGEIVQFDNVGLRYGSDREVLSDVSFTLFPGSF